MLTGFILKYYKNRWILIHRFFVLGVYKGRSFLKSNHQRSQVEVMAFSVMINNYYNPDRLK
jgi:hypothetical protein